MADSNPKSVEEFGASFKGFLDQMATQAPAEDPVFLVRLRSHFGADPTAYPIVREQFDASNPNAEGFDANSDSGCLARAYRNSGGPAITYAGLGWRSFRHAGEPGLWGVRRNGGSPNTSTSLFDDQVLACVQCGLYLVTLGSVPLAVWSRPSDMGASRGVHVEAMAADRSAPKLLADIGCHAQGERLPSHVISLIVTGTRAPGRVPSSAGHSPAGDHPARRTAGASSARPSASAS
jgi:hypothetical protein